MDYVFPKFGDRELGLHAPVGKTAGINSIIIILLAPVVGALTQRFSRLSDGRYSAAQFARLEFSSWRLPTEWFRAAGE